MRCSVHCLRWRTQATEELAHWQLAAQQRQEHWEEAKALAAQHSAELALVHGQLEAAIEKLAASEQLHQRQEASLSEDLRRARATLEATKLQHEAARADFQSKAEAKEAEFCDKEQQWKLKLRTEEKRAAAAQQLAAAAAAREKSLTLELDDAKRQLLAKSELLQDAQRRG